MRNIFVAKDPAGELLGIVLHEQKDIADAYFMGKYPDYHSMEELRFDELDKIVGEGRLAILVQSEKKQIGEFGNRHTYNRVFR